jgi:sterol desaturase/sphingolipid hydroxylase (fatty acid hydroxylase superfamily)
MEILRYLQTHLSPFQLSVFRLAVWLVLLTAIFVPVERLWAVRRQKISRPALGTDLAYFFLNSMLPALILAYPLYYLGSAAHRFLPWHVHLTVAAMPVWLQLAAAFVVGQVGAYWGHRWSHEWPLLWRFHAVHHSSEEIDFLVNTRAHPLDMVFTRLCGYIPLFLLGLAQPPANADPLIPILIVLIGTFWGFFVHANVRWRFGPLEWLIATPAFHHWHHTQGAMTDRNYAATLPWLDRLFGTYYMPKQQWPERYGTDTPVSRNLLGQLVDPLLPEVKRPTVKGDDLATQD